tara:strand:+ start:69716 stop:70231 length:516 start_codon:yes stop_codon:yes gene_type:complete
MKKNILITGFTPFLDHKINPSQEIANLLKDSFSTIVFEVSYEKVTHKLLQLDLESYDAIILLGLSSNRNKISIEKFAYNLIDVAKPDNDNIIKQNEPILVGGRPKISTEFNLGEITKVLEEEWQYSDDPGRYLCNFLFYKVLNRNRNSVFIHLPKNCDSYRLSENIKKLFS